MSSPTSYASHRSRNPGQRREAHRPRNRTHVGSRLVHPRIVVVSDSNELAHEVAQELNATRRFVVASRSRAEFDAGNDFEAHAAVFVLQRAPGSIVSLPPFVQHRGRRIPIVAAVTRRDEGERDLSGSEPDRGSPSAEVFEWPVEANALREVLSRGLSPRGNRLETSSFRSTLVRDAKIRSLVARERMRPPSTPYEVQGDRILVGLRDGEDLEANPVVDAARRLDPRLKIEPVLDANLGSALLMRAAGEARRLLRDLPGFDARCVVVAPTAKGLLVTGSVSDARDLERALVAVRGAAGLSPVQNRLEIDPGRARSDAWRAVELQHALRDVSIARCDIAVADNHVYVAGVVHTSDAASTVRRVLVRSHPRADILTRLEIEAPAVAGSHVRSSRAPSRGAAPRAGRAD